jgi:Polyketide cyclase / dehydrase and lipid transport
MTAQQSRPGSKPSLTRRTGGVRGTDLEIVRSVGVRRGAEDVFGYASDFARASEWRAEVVESTPTPPGPMRVGTRLREVAIISGRRMITESVIDAYDPPRRFCFAHVSGPLPVSGEYRVDPAPGGATLTYILRVRLLGWWRLLAPVFRRTGPRTMARSLEVFAQRLESDVPTGS